MIAAAEQTSRDARDTRLADPLAHRIESIVLLALVLVPLLGTVAAIATLWGRGVSGLDLALLLSTWLVTGFGITVGYHRLLSHGAFRAVPRLRAVLAICGSMALQGPVVRWVADHRRHHAFGDRPGDPHSPHTHDRGPLAGLWHAHWGWFFGNEKTRAHRFAPDLLEDPLIRRIDHLYPLWALLTLGLPPLIAWLVTGPTADAGSAFLWGSLARLFVVHHVTWSINSICHRFGTRPFQSRDRSTNCGWLAIPSLGEAWHNGHHAFPSSAVHGLEPYQLDLSALLIRGFERLGLASEVKRPSARKLEQNRRAAGSREA